MSENRMENEEPAQEPVEDQDPAVAAEAARREAEENRDKYLRTAAELDNLRKRMVRDVEAARKSGAERLAKALLPVRDSMEAALVAGSRADPKTLLEGQQATLRLLDDALTAADIKVIDPHGEPFDPHKHEALSLVPATQVEPNTVLEVIQKGYQMQDRLLRAAKVIVARPENGGDA